MTQKTPQNPWIMDVRVRERNLKSGSLTEKELEKQLAALPDLVDQSEAFGTSQPALAQPEKPPVVHHAPVEMASSDLGADEEEDEDEEDDEDEDKDEVEAPAAEPAPEGGSTDGEGTP